MKFVYVFELYYLISLSVTALSFLRSSSLSGFQSSNMLRNTFHSIVKYVKPNKFNLRMESTSQFISNLPAVHAGDVHFKRSLRHARKMVKLDSNIKNVRNAQRKLAAHTLDTLMKSLTVPITNVLHLYDKQIKYLHPFEKTVIDLTLTARIKSGNPDLQSILSDLKQLRANTTRIGKEFASQANKAESASEAKSLLADGIASLEEFYMNSRESRALQSLKELQQDLTRIPKVELDIPTVVLVGSPNVGKSSIVRAVSSGTPEVNDYPFTTRGVTVGHIFDKNVSPPIRYQVMDTPGLLDRAQEDRNEMERLTYAAMAHLPTAVVYVIDPTGVSGEKSSLRAQLNIREELRGKFPRRPWIDVITKDDIMISEEVKEQINPLNALSISVHSGKNVNILKHRLELMLQEVGVFLQDMEKAETEV